MVNDLTADRGYYMPNATGTVALTQQATDYEVTNSSAGIIMKSPNNSRWRITVDNSGVLLRTALALLFSLSFMCGSQAQVRDLVYGTNNVVIGPTNTNALAFTNSVAFSNPLTFGTNAATTRTNLGVTVASNLPAPYSGAAATNSLLTADGAGGSAFVSTIPKLTIASGTITNTNPALTISQTWSNSNSAFTGLLVNITNTASAATSKLIDLQLGGTSQFYVDRTGSIVGNVANAATLLTSALNYVSFDIRGGGGATASGIRFAGTGTGSQAMDFWAINGTYIFNSSASSSSGSGFRLVAESNDVCSIRNGTNPQTYNVYNTYSNSTNYERGKIAWTTNNVLTIGTEKGTGGGSARALELQTDGTTRFTISTSGSCTTAGNLFISGYAQVTQGNSYRTSGRWRLTSDATSGRLILTTDTDLTAGAADFGSLCFGGTTSSFPALKRTNTVLQVRLADDSAYTTIDAQHRLQGTAPTNSTDTGTAGDIRWDTNNFLYICVSSNTWRRTSLTNW